MATKTTTENVETLTLVHAEPVTLETVEQLKAEAKRATDALRAAKAALPKMSPLEIVLAKQAAGISDKRAREYFSGLVRARVKAGQNVEEARQEVLAMFTAWLIEESASIANDV